MRQVYVNDKRITKQINQGSIINNCIADNYNCEVYGVIVTPRCDLAHEGKVAHVHYLPIVSFADWYKKDGLEYLWTKQKLTYEKSIIQECNNNNFPTAHLKETQLRLLAESLSEASKRDKFCSSISQYFNLIKTHPTDYIPNKEQKQKLIENIRANNIAGYHLIEDWRTSDSYCVVLLRDLKRLQFNVATSLGHGIDEASITDTRKNDLSYSIGHDLIYSIDAEIASPYVEQLMERFSRNFCRVGVEDFDNKTVETILNRVMNV